MFHLPYNEGGWQVSLGFFVQIEAALHFFIIVISSKAGTDSADVVDNCLCILFSTQLSVSRHVT